MVQFKPRERKHKKRARIEKTQSEEGQAQNDQSIRDNVGVLTAPGMSSKKRKRLDKYLENKLRKDENARLLKKLAETKVDTSLLQSSKDIGKRAVSKRDALGRALKYQRAGIDTENDRALLYEAAPDRSDVIELVTVVEEAAPAAVSAPEPTPATTSVPVSASAEQATDSHQTNSISSAPKLDTTLSFGGGLKNPLPLDEYGIPIIKKRERLAKTTIVSAETPSPTWSGFSSGSESEDNEDNDEDDSASVTTNTGSEATNDSEEDLEHGWKNAHPLFEAPGATAQSIRIKPRAQSDFKTWAREQVNQVQGFQPSALPSLSTLDQGKELKLQKLRPREEDPLPAELEIPTSTVSRQVHSVQVHRSPQIRDSRMKLPVVADEQKIMEAINNNPITIVCGATGSGKTTQIPQFLFESGYGDPNGPTPGLIGVTQPRRVAAVTMAKRVGEELMNPNKSAYQIRYDSSVNSQTAVKFMTDGILIREISQDLLLSRYSAIVIDEVHERSVNTDILIGMISRIVNLREEQYQKNPDMKPLKLVIMSATLMAETFLNNSRLFPNAMPPLVESEGRQYPITLHFSRRTQRDYIQEAFQKIVKGHRKLPPGGILVFLTGQNEINDLSKKLHTALSAHAPSSNDTRIRITNRDAPLESDDLDLMESRTEHQDVSEESSDEDEDAEFDIEEKQTSSLKAVILPLYSQLPTKDQLRVFEPPPDNTRLIILATNVAETSVTIPGIRYVFDSGRSKEKKYDPITGVQTLEIGWISKASAIQRAGRAGRTGPGHCYRLYSSAMYERDFAEHTDPEILRTPIENVVLQLKSMNLQDTTRFPFPTPPNSDSLVRAEKLLSYLRALDEDGRVTDLGRDLSMYPVSPRLARILSVGHQYDSIYHVAAMVAALAVPELFIPHGRLDLLAENENEEGNTPLQAYRKAHQKFSAHDSTSDAVKSAVALCAYMWAKDTTTFCTEWFLQAKAMKEASRLYTQLLHTINHNIPGSVDTSKHKLPIPNKAQLAVLKQTVTIAFIDQIAIRADLAPTPITTGTPSSKASDVAYLPLFPIDASAPRDTISQLIFTHPSSLLAATKTKSSMPAYLVYAHIQRSTRSTIPGTSSPRTWMFPLTAVSGSLLASLARNTPLLEYSKPIGRTEAVEGSSNQRYAWVVPNLVGERGGQVWPLCAAVKTLQTRDAKGVWRVRDVLG